MRFKLDEYDLRARVLPAMLITLPVVTAVYVFLPGARGLAGVISGSVVEYSVLFLLARIARDRGKRIQESLYKKWGGKPTTAMLRHRDTRIDPLTKDRYKQTLSGLSLLSFPSETDEEGDPIRADQTYESAVRALIEKRRSKTYRLVFAENCNFGFVRNLLGLKLIGLAVAVASLVADGALIWRNWGNTSDVQYVPVIVAIALIVLLLFVTEPSARRTAEAYAEALLRTCERSATPVARAKTRVD